MARKQLYLHKRGGVYQLRVRVPDALRPMVGKTEVWKSLQTGDLRVAQKRALLERVKIDAHWSELWQQLDAARQEPLSDSEVWGLVVKWFVAAERKNVESATEPVDRHKLELTRSDLEDWDTSAPVMFAEAAQLFEGQGIPLEPYALSGTVRPKSDVLAGPSAEHYAAFSKLQRLLHRAAIEVERRKFSRQFPETPLALDAEFRDLGQTTVLQPVAKTTLSSLMQAIENDPLRPAPAPKSLLKRNAQWTIFKQFFGADTDLKTIERDNIREFLKLLQRLPSNASKHFPGRTVFEAVAMGSELPKLQPETANTYLKQLGALFKYALDERMIDVDPSAGMLFPKSKVRAKDKRLSFSGDDLKAIFSAPLYKGCVNDGNGYAKPGSKVIRRGRFWVPLVCLFTGMRLNEACQLTADDFVVQDGVNVILIREDDDGETKRVKTEAGIRFVPVHPELKKLGLLSFVEARRIASGETAPLFPDLPIGSVGNRADPFSKWFARFLDSVGIRNRRKVFHSFRHSYRDALREARVPLDDVLALGGWSTGRTEGRYGDGLRARNLARTIEAVRYEGLDLSHLYQ